MIELEDAVPPSELHLDQALEEQERLDRLVWGLGFWGLVLGLGIGFWFWLVGFWGFRFGFFTFWGFGFWGFWDFEIWLLLERF